MSNYTAPAIHPDTGKTETATFIDDYFGRHRYGVKFEDGKVFRIYEVSLPEDEHSERTRA